MNHVQRIISIDADTKKSGVVSINLYNREIFLDSLFFPELLRVIFDSLRPDAPLTLFLIESNCNDNDLYTTLKRSILSLKLHGCSYIEMSPLPRLWQGKGGKTTCTEDSKYHY